jgi:uncharacterized pyridoxal phosphate-containing UPF0001 family protein
VTTISTSPPSCASDEVAERLAAVRLRITQAGGDPARVRIVAVTKGFGLDVVHAAREAGIRDFGENYAGELLAKASAVPVDGGAAVDGEGRVPGRGPDEGMEGAGIWHFLGAIQRNKVPALAPVVGVWQSVAREAEGARIARSAPGASVMVQVDVTGLPGRNGCAPPDVPGLVTQLRQQGLNVLGLMTVAAQGRAAAEAAFSQVARLADRLELRERSLGMSDDLEAAVAAGSTMVRIGRALFGERPPRASASLSEPTHPGPDLR